MLVLITGITVLQKITVDKIKLVKQGRERDLFFYRHKKFFLSVTKASTAVLKTLILFAKYLRNFVVKRAFDCINMMGHL